jgi:hypothetical protein
MKNIDIKIKLYANKEVDFSKEVLLQDNSDGNGVFIAEWNLDIPKPTLEQLEQYEAQANIVESNQAQVQNRIKEYGTIAQQIEYITENGLDAWQTKRNKMSKIEVDAIEPQSGTSLTLGASGDTITIPSGATLTNSGTATGFGKVLQVVSTTKTDTASLTDTYSYTDISGMSVSITPSTTSSKILILSTLNIASGAASYGANVRLVRDSTAILIGDAASSRVQATFATIVPDSNFAFPQTINFLDSPSTTSAITYKIQWNISYDNGTPIIYLNRSVNDTDSSAVSRTASSIIAIEVAG